MDVCCSGIVADMDAASSRMGVGIESGVTATGIAFGFEVVDDVVEGMNRTYIGACLRLERTTYVDSLILDTGGVGIGLWL